MLTAGVPQTVLVPLQISSDVFVSSDGVSIPSVLKQVKGNTVLQCYSVISFLGKGAFGRCYEVTKVNSQDSRTFACKILNKANFTSDKICDRVRYEIRVMKRLPRHENVVGFFGVFEDSASLYLLMEKCTSRTLHDLLLRRKKLTEFEACFYMKQLAGGIAALHSVGIIHRDIKHSNLLLDSMNRIKIADFGLSTIVESPQDRKLSFLGTPNFLAPELVTKGGHSFGVDVWAAGVLLFVMLYGRPPFSVRNNNAENNIKQLYHRIAAQDISFPTEIHVSYSVQNLIKKLCCRDEDQRMLAMDICEDAWFLVAETTGIPRSMPPSIFTKPIHNMDEYRFLMGTGVDVGKTTANTGFTNGNSHTNTPTNQSLKKQSPADVRSMRRQPLEPIPENGMRTNGAKPLAAAMAANKTPVASIRSTRQLRTAPMTATTDKENRQSEIYSTHSYSLRTRNGKSDSNGVQAHDSYRKSAPPPSIDNLWTQARLSALNGATEVSNRIQAEIGQAISISEGYVPSLLRWKDRLRRFCEQTELYSKQPISVLQRNLAGIPMDVARNYPRVGTHVINWCTLPKYGFGFRLSDKTNGALYNDSTSLSYVEESDSYVYVRPYLSRTSIGYYPNERLPNSLEKKRRLLHMFAHQIDKKFSSNVDYDICPREELTSSSRCILQALSTTAGVVFLLTGGMLQFVMNDRSKLFLYQDAHIFFKDRKGRKWHFDLDKGPAMLISDPHINVEQFLLCLGYAQKVLMGWDLPG
ncbi:Cell cycle serine/threonine-protein kinase cdc5/MSD2 [Coemansia sp. RSA 1722]|nr:Cell cycle serine/threonine-protein kinase cdc5/MSD2 [Coemansia sp. RSA 1722]